MPGSYPLPVKIETYAGSATYENLLTARITSEPLEVRYPSASGRMEYNMAFLGSTPSLKGSPDEVVWAIKQVIPAEGTDPTDKIKIDPATGVVSVDAGSELPIDASYTLDLTVKNSFGSTDFDGAYTLSVIEFIAPIESDKFGYEDAVAIQGGEFKVSKKAGFVGDEVTFSLGDVPAGVQGQISIDPVTGDVSAAKGHSIPMGVYDIPVKASNLKGEAETTLKLTVNENPYYFTTITYGNNLGLTPVENYANQFYFAAAADFTELTPTTDAKPGTKLSWSIKIKHQCSGTLIDSETGAITPKGFKSGNGGLVLVTATAGEGEVGETSITVPVFFSFHVPVSGVTVRYKPFVMQVNPRRGGTSVVPEITGVPNLSSFLLDYRRTFNYYNIGGPASHKDGTPAASTDTFLYQMWKAYYNSIGSATVGTGSKDPISYYVNTARLGSALAYVEPATKSVVVNANKWIDSNNVAANGAFIAQMTFVTDGNSGGINSGSQIFPIWIWFDEKF